MKSPYFAIILIFVLISVLQLTVKLKVLFNAKKNIGKIQLKFIGIRILDYEFSIHLDYIKLTSKKGKNTYLPIEFNEEAFEQYSNFQEILFKKTYCKNLAIYFNFGAKNNAFLTSMACGYIDVLSKILYSVFKTKKSELIFASKIYPSFENDVIKIGIKAKISLSLYDLTWSFLEAKIGEKIRLKRSLKNARQQKN